MKVVRGGGGGKRGRVLWDATCEGCNHNFLAECAKHVHGSEHRHMLVAHVLYVVHGSEHRRVCGLGFRV